jgi:hypothetical protein
MPQAKAMVVAHNVFAGRGDPKVPRTMAATGNVHLPLDQVEDAAAEHFQARQGCLAVQTAPPGWATEWLPQRQFKAPVGTRPRTTQTCAGAVEG